VQGGLYVIGGRASVRPRARAPPKGARATLRGRGKLEKPQWGVGLARTRNCGRGGAGQARQLTLESVGHILEGVIRRDPADTTQCEYCAIPRWLPGAEAMASGWAPARMPNEALR
jgi:hypothetical protein